MKVLLFFLAGMVVIGIQSFDMIRRDLTMTKDHPGHCTPCEGKVGKLAMPEIEKLLTQYPNWKHVKIDDIDRIERTLTFANFVDAMAYVNKLADIAESEGHHPDISIFYNTVKIQLYTHAVSGLSNNDFILAYHVDMIYKKQLSEKKPKS